jgi:hypothetical protein
MDRTRVVRAWLDEGSTDLSPRVFDAILSEVPATSQDRPHWSPPRLHMTSFVAGVAATAVTLVVALVGAGLIGGLPPGGAGSTPAPPEATPSPTPQRTIDRSYRDVGFSGLPPLSAMPTDPTPTDLVENFFLPTGISGFYYMGGAFLYADGRLIWNEYYNSNTASTGWLEQRLTGVGILLALEQAAPGRVGELATPRFLDPRVLPVLLPEDAWVDATVRPYVPNGFAACVFVDDWVAGSEEPPTFTAAERIAMLPTSAADLLRDATRFGRNVYSSQEPEPDDTACYALSLADARRLDAALRVANFERTDSFMIKYHLNLDPPPDWTRSVPRLNVWFEPILPDGTFPCSACG